MYRNTTPATPAPKIQAAGRCGNTNRVDQLCHPRSDAYSAEQVLLNKAKQSKLVQKTGEGQGLYSHQM